MKFASPEKIAANIILQDYDVAQPWKVLSGAEAQRAITNAEEIEEVAIGNDQICLVDHMVLDANNIAFVFVRG